MKKIGASTILLAMAIPLLGWAGITIIENKAEISSLRSESTSTKDDLKYIRDKVDKIHQAIYQAK